MDKVRTGLVPAKEALELILDDAGPGREETAALHEAAFRVLSRDLAARRTQPPFPASAMDGYAVRAADIQTVPATLRVAGQSAAGHPFAGTLGAGEAARIFTGAPMPPGADTVVMQENTEAHDGLVAILVAAERGRFVRPEGLDFRVGDRLLRQGDLLGPQQLSLAASMNHARLPVYAKPKVALIATGDELVMPGDIPGDGGIIASNIFGLAAIVAEAGGEPLDLGIVRDTKEALAGAIDTAIARGASLIVTTGGASVGDHDLVKPTLLALQASLDFEKVAMRPGKPMLSGKLARDGRQVRFLGLAGNPVSSLVAANVFLRPLVNKLAGRPPRLAVPVPAILSGELPANDEREDYLRAAARRDKDGALIVEPFDRQDSSMLALLARAEALVVRPPHAEAAKAGSPCHAILLRAV